MSEVITVKAITIESDALSTNAVNVNLGSDALSGWLHVESTGNITFTSTSYTANRERSVVVTNTHTSAVTLTFPAAWKFIGGKPSGIAAGKAAVLSLRSTGTTEGAVVAAWAQQDALPEGETLLHTGSDYYNTGNLLGTVSQSAGVPTGAIIERGSNANGEYVRFADGTQICTRTASIPADSTAQTSYNFSFPAEFVAVPAASMSLYDGGTKIWTWLHAMGIRSQTTTVWNVLHDGTVASEPASTVIQVKLMAVGRWW